MVDYKIKKKGLELVKEGSSMPDFLKRFSEIVGSNPEVITEDFAKEFWDNYEGKDIYSTIINDSRCFTLKQIAYMDQKENEEFEISYNRIWKRFDRKAKNGEMIEGVDYYEIKPMDNMSTGKFKEKIYITIHSMGKLLFNARNSKELFYWFWNKMSDRVNLISLGESYKINKNKELVDQILGDPKGNYTDCMGWRYSSKDEMLIAEVLHKLGIKFLPNSPINLPQELKKDIKKKFNMKYPWPYITADFLILTLPKTVIEHWGIKNNPSYDWKRKVKTYIYEKLEIRVINTEPNEPQNKLGLKRKLEELFN